MTRLRLAVGIVLASAVCACAQGPKETVHFRITGTVVNDRNGEPVPFCHLSASPAVMARGFGQRMGGEEGGFGGPRQEQAETEADAKGRFTLEVATEGRYRLSANGHGFRMQMFEAHGAFSTAIVLTKAAPTHAVVFRASSDAIISGTVTDEAGEGVRGAQVKLYAVGDPARAPDERRLQMRNVAVTDDRGHYELPSTTAGSYKVSVTGRPWYATASAPAQTVNGIAVPSPDPSLDVVYPVVWFPGVEDESAAEKIDLKFGEKRQFDFRLSPVASAHVFLTRPTVPPPTGGQVGGRPGGVGLIQMMPNLQQVMPDGTLEMARGFNRFQANGGQIDIGGLTPGTYRLSQPGSEQDGSQSFSILHVTAGGSVSGSSASAPEIPVVIRVDGDPTVTAGQIQLIDVESGQPVGRGGMPRRGGPQGDAGGGGGRRGGEGAPTEATLQVQPGTYEVTANGRDSFLTGVSATGAQVTGRLVKIVEGNPHLLVHMAAGLASLEGTANRLGKPASGAMVLLVPATMGDPASLAFLRRAQTATDGSFQLPNVIPGQYILLAIDHGWGVNWRDPATLAPYLLQGEPLDLTAAATVHPVVKAAAP